MLVGQNTKEKIISDFFAQFDIKRTNSANTAEYGPVDVKYSNNVAKEHLKSNLVEFPENKPMINEELRINNAPYKDLLRKLNERYLKKKYLIRVQHELVKYTLLGGLLNEFEFLFFKATKTRFALKIWIMREIRALFCRTGRKPISIVNIYKNLKKTYDSGAFSYQRLCEMLETEKQLNWNQFLSLERRFKQEYEIFVTGDSVSYSSQLDVLRHALATCEYHNIDSVAHAMSQTSGISKDKAMKYLLVSPWVYFDDYHNVYINNDSNYNQQDMGGLLWRIEMLLAHGFIDEEHFVSISQQKNKEELTLSSLPQFALFTCNPEYAQHPLLRLYCWDVPLWLIEQLKTYGLEMLADLGTEKGVRAIEKAIKSLSSRISSAWKIHEALMKLKDAVAFLCSTSSDKVHTEEPLNPWMFKSYVMRSDKRVWDVVLQRQSGKTLEAISRQYQITRERVRQIELKALKRIDEWLSQNCQLLINRTQIYRHLIDIELVTALLGEEGITALLHCIANYQNIKRFYYWKGPNLLLVDAGEEFFQLLQQADNEIKTADNDNAVIDKLTCSLRNAGYRFITREIIIAHFKKLGYRRYGDVIKRRNIPLRQAVSLIASRYFTMPLRMADAHALDELKERLKEMGLVHRSGDRALWSIVQKVMVLCDRGSYIAPNRVLFSDQLCEDICKYVESIEGKSITYSQLFYRFQDRLLVESNVHNPYFLHGSLVLRQPDRFIYKRDLILRKDSSAVYTNAYHLLAEFLLNARQPVAKSEIFQQFPGWTDIRICNAQTAYPEILSWGNGYYLHADILQYDDYDKERLRLVLESSFDETDDVVGSTKIYEALQLYASDILRNNGVENEQQSYRFIKYLFCENYFFSWPYILRSREGRRAFTHQDCIKTCLGPKQSFNRDTLRTEMIRRVGRQTGGIDSAIRKFCAECFQTSENEYTLPFAISENILQQINMALGALTEKSGLFIVSGTKKWPPDLPDLPVEWTPYLLSDITEKLLPDFRVVWWGKGTEPQYAIVPNDSPLQ